MPKHSTPQKSKRTRTTSPSGWTHITHGPTPHLPPHHTTALQQQHAHSTSSPNSTALETYVSKFRNYYIPQWLSSTCHANLSQLFINEILPSTRHNKITNYICLGLGSPTTSTSSNAPSWQLAALISILKMILLDDNNTTTTTISSSSPPTGRDHKNNRDEISERNQPFPIIFQDPIFTPLDILFLTEHLPTLFPLFLNPTSTSTPSTPSTPSTSTHPVTHVSVSVKVVKDPEAMGMIGEGTFLFAPHLEVGVFARALEGAEKGKGEGKGGKGPWLCVGSDLGGYVDGLLGKHAEEARAGSVEVFKRFREGREEREMPGFERGDWCVALRVYWRKGEGDGDGRDEGEGEGEGGVGDEGVEEMVRVLEGQRL